MLVCFKKATTAVLVTITCGEYQLEARGGVVRFSLERVTRGLEQVDVGAGQMVD